MTIEEKINRGVEFLNEVRPEWLNEIDLDELDIFEPDRCMLGQLKAYKRMDNSDLSMYDLGFAGEGCDYRESCNQLTDAWKEKIMELRNEL